MTVSCDRGECMILFTLASIRPAGASLGMSCGRNVHACYGINSVVEDLALVHFSPLL